MKQDNRYSRAVALSLVMGLLAVFSPASDAASKDADLRELQRYELTMSDLRKYASASESLARFEKAKQRDDEDSDDDSDDEGDNGMESLDDMVAKINRAPEARKAIEAAGLTVRQYAVITMALFQAAFAQFAIDQGADPAKVARDASVNPANLRFVKEHKAEIEKLRTPRG